jgi:pimeloyl-ACP methyl ester carboxylesterase
VPELTVPTGDGGDVRAADDGAGNPVLVLHPGFDDGSSWGRVASRLAPRFRVIRPVRRQYRLDLAHRSNRATSSHRCAPTADAAQMVPCSIADEVADVLALVAAIGGPVLLVGHSSGAVVALEALVASPASFAGAVLYEPPVHLRAAEWTAWIAQANAALAAGRPGTAMALFVREIVGMPRWVARLVGALTAVVPRYRALVPCQTADAEAINDLGVRLDAYAAVRVPTVLLTGSRSPAHLRERIDALAATMPGTRTVVLSGQGHDAQLKNPAAVVDAIEALSARVWG